MTSGFQVTTREAALVYRVSPRTIRRWAQTDRLDAIKTGGRWVITIEANLDTFKPEQIEKAREAIEQQAILPTSRPGLFTTVSSDGSTTYLTHSCGCTCRAGQRGIRCWHRAAVAILTAAAAPARRAA